MRNGIIPTRFTLFLFCFPLLLIIVSFRISILSTIAFGWDILIFFIIILDIFLSPNYHKKIKLTCIPPKNLKLNGYSDFMVTVENRNRLPVRFKFILDLDIAFERAYSNIPILIAPLHTEDIHLKIFAKRRGQFVSKWMFIKGKSLFGLLYFYRRFKHEPADLSINVVPSSFFQGESFKFLQKKIKKLEGYQKNKMLGDGKDFEMLRDYIKGDEYSKIDWKATARRYKPATRIYRLENNFELSIMIDCGRLMSTEMNGMSLLDYAVNASLILSYAAVKGNDSVSFTAFGSNIIKYLPPSKNLKTVKKMNYVLTDLQYQFAESDYQTAFAFIQSKLSKRSLVVLFTDIIDDSSIKIYHKYLSLLKKHHLVLLILLRDKNLFDYADALPGKKVTLYTKAAAIDLVSRRNKTIHTLKKLGIEVLDLFPEAVLPETINKYLNLKHHN